MPFAGKPANRIFVSSKQHTAQLSFMKGWLSGIQRGASFYLPVLLLLSISFQACGVLYPNRMLDADKEQAYQSFLDTTYTEFTIAPGDILEVYIFPNAGYNLVESQISIINNAFQPQTFIVSLDYMVDATGSVNLPRVGNMRMSGLTESAAEKMLAQAYSQWYTDAFVNVYIKNKFFTVYRGSMEAKRVEMTRSDITVLEAIGMSGGIPENGRSAAVKIVRKTPQGNLVQELDLSDMQDLSLAMSYIRPNDIIYIEPNINSQFFREVAPIISTVSGIAVIYAFFANISN